MKTHRPGGRLATVLAGLMIATPLLAASASEAATATPRAVTSTQKSVLASEFGRARSHIEGSFGQSGVVTGTFTPHKFKVGDAGNLRAVGKLKATLTRANGNVVGTTTQRVSLLVATVEGTGLPDARALRA